MEKEKFVPTPMPLLYFNHECDEIYDALGVSKQRAKELKRQMEDLFDIPDEESKKRYDKFTKRLEVVLALAKNEQERICITLWMGNMQRKAADKFEGITAVGSDELPPQIRDAILKAIMKRKGHKPPADDADEDED